MRIILCLLLTVVILYVPACKNNGSSSVRNTFFGRDFSSLADRIVAGDKEANKVLKLYDSSSLPAGSGNEKLIVDSLLMNHNKYYYLLLEFSDPEYNRLAIYNSTADLLLMDKSLNGEVSLDRLENEGTVFLRAVESFLSKDIINLKRLSLYRIDKTKTTLALRTYITLVKPDAFLSQDIDVFTNDTITTIFTLPSSMAKNHAAADTFIYDKSFGKFLSKKNIFDSIVKNQVKNFNQQSGNP